MKRVYGKIALVTGEPLALARPARYFSRQRGREGSGDRCQ